MVERDGDKYVYESDIKCTACGWYSKIWISPGAFHRGKIVLYCPFCGIEEPTKTGLSPDRTRGKERAVLLEKYKQQEAELKKMKDELFDMGVTV